MESYTSITRDTTLWSIKTGHYIIGDNFVTCEPIFTTFALLRRKLNFEQNPCNISHFTLTLIPHYTITTTTTTTTTTKQEIYTNKQNSDVNSNHTEQIRTVLTCAEISQKAQSCTSGIFRNSVTVTVAKTKVWGRESPTGVSLTG